MSSNSEKQTRRSASTGDSSTRSDLNRIEGTGNAWWTEAPTVAILCLQIAQSPFKLIAATADLIVALIFISVIAIIALWWTGHIPDQIVSDVMGELGGRILAIIEKSNLL